MLRTTTVLLLALIAWAVFDFRAFVVTVAVGYLINFAATFPRRRARWRRRRLRRRVGRMKRVQGEWRALMRAAWSAYDDYVAVVRSTPTRSLRRRLDDGRPLLEAGLQEAASLVRTASQLERTISRNGVAESGATEAARHQVDAIHDGLRHHVAAMQAAAIHAAQLAVESAASHKDELESSLQDLQDDLAALAAATLEIQRHATLSPPQPHADPETVGQPGSPGLTSRPDSPDLTRRPGWPAAPPSTLPPPPRPQVDGEVRQLGDS